MAAITAVSGCSGESPNEEDPTANEMAGVTNKGATDPGVRPGPAGAGAQLAAQPIDSDAPLNGNKAEAEKAAAACFPGLSPAAQLFCTQAVIRFQETDAVSGQGISTGVPGFIAAGTPEGGTGLGPMYNANGCHVCHSQPGVLGAGVSLGSPQFPGVPNPQVALATADGAKNILPPFITKAGPIREVRFKSDGGVHDLFTIAGRTDAAGCNAAQPDFAAAAAADNLSFRIPLPMFGDGLVENIPESDLEANLAKSAGNGIKGTFNRSGNDGSITRLGWKAQNKSAIVFAMEAYNVEQGVTNIGFPDERAGGGGHLQGCMTYNPTPEDNANIAGNGPFATLTCANAGDAISPSDFSSDVLNFAAAISLSAPPKGALAPFTLTPPPGVSQSTITEGENEFIAIGCAKCHTQQFTTGTSSFDSAMSNVPFRPYSDFALHNMGTRLADGVTQGNAGPQQFRTAPLWGVGQRMFFLHDGRTNDLTAAIADHASPGSEANNVIDAFNYLSKAQQQSIIDFLRAL
jgi:hypothetical protein